MIGSYWQNPSVGGGSVDLDGNNPGGISQTLTNLNPGNYVLTFSLSGNPEGGLGAKSLNVSVGNVAGDPLSYTVTGANSKSNMLYATETVDFSVSGAGPQSTVLSFLSTDLSGATGPVIGNVIVSEVPLPAGLPLFGVALLGLAAFGFSRRRQSI